jgi:hypothetical protein
LKPVYQADDLDGGGVDDADVEAVDQHQGRGSGDAAVVEPARVRGEFAVGVDVVTAARARGWLSEVFGGVLWVGSVGRRGVRLAVETATPVALWLYLLLYL